MINGLVMVLIFIVSIFMILLILVQRGRGGGLAGAFGGMGGQSAFGTKAGDLFTRITVVTFAVWILLAMLAVVRFSSESNYFGGGLGGAAQPTTPQIETTAPPVGTSAPGEDATGSPSGTPSPSATPPVGGAAPVSTTSAPPGKNE